MITAKKLVAGVLLAFVAIPVSLRGYQLYLLSDTIKSSRLIFPPSIERKVEGSPDIVFEESVFEEIDLDGTVITEFSLSLKVPVDVYKLENPAPMDSLAYYYSEKNSLSKTVFIRDNASDPDIVDSFISTIGRDRATSLFGRNALVSDFAFRQRLYDFNPDSVGFFSSLSEYKLAFIAVLFRSMDIDNNDDLYRFVLPSGLTGFQYGDPAEDSKVRIELHKDTLLYTLTFTDFTLAEIDSMLLSIRLREKS
ncbi:hypothetical protein ACWJJH_03085 [Endozoicomonadaceae bacterium StTr2]